MSKATATEVAGSVNLDSVLICTGEPYEVIKVLGKVSYRFVGLLEAGNLSKGTQSTQQTAKRGVYTRKKKLYFEHVSLRGKTEDLTEMSNGDIDNLFTL